MNTLRNKFGTPTVPLDLTDSHAPRHGLPLCDYRHPQTRVNFRQWGWNVPGRPRFSVTVRTSEGFLVPSGLAKAGFAGHFVHWNPQARIMLTDEVIPPPVHPELEIDHWDQTLNIDPIWGWLPSHYRDRAIPIRWQPSVYLQDGQDVPITTTKTSDWGTISSMIWTKSQTKRPMSPKYAHCYYVAPSELDLNHDDLMALLLAEISTIDKRLSFAASNVFGYYELDVRSTRYEQSDMMQTLHGIPKPTQQRRYSPRPNR